MRQQRDGMTKQRSDRFATPDGILLPAIPHPGQ